MSEHLDAGIMLAVGAFLWRELAALDNRLSALAGRVSTLAERVSTIGERIASLEGRITGWQDRHGPEGTPLTRDHVTPDQFRAGLADLEGRIADLEARVT